MSWPIAIVGTGAVTAVGLGTAQTATSVRAGIGRIRELAMEGKDGEPLRGGFLRDEHLEAPHRKLRDVAPGSLPERLLRLAAPALREAVAPLAGGEPPAVVLGVATRELLAGGPPEAFLENLSRQAQVRLDLARSEVVVGGRAAGLLAIQEGCRRLAGGGPPIVAGAVDSYLDGSRLVRLDLDDRLLGPSSPDGFLPGEGAAFVSLARPRDPAVASAPVALLAGAAEAFEEGHLGSAKPMRGDGLAAALDALLTALPPALLPCRVVFANLDGESLGASQWGIAFLRNRRHFAEGATVVHPAEHLGEAGAAMGAILVALAAHALERDRSAPPVLVWCTADEGECAAAYVTSSGSKERT